VGLTLNLYAIAQIPDVDHKLDGARQISWRSDSI
jgi:hypothetical protein